MPAGSGDQRRARGGVRRPAPRASSEAERCRFGWGASGRDPFPDPSGIVALLSAESKLTLSTADIPTKTENAPIVSESSIHDLDDLKRHRPNEVAFKLAKRPG
jgi:hypothetical protein